jgi:hypothetical protein
MSELTEEQCARSFDDLVRLCTSLASIYESNAGLYNEDVRNAESQSVDERAQLRHLGEDLYAAGGQEALRAVLARWVERFPNGQTHNHERGWQLRYVENLWSDIGGSTT